MECCEADGQADWSQIGGVECEGGGTDLRRASHREFRRGGVARVGYPFVIFNFVCTWESVERAAASFMMRYLILSAITFLSPIA